MPWSRVLQEKPQHYIIFLAFIIVLHMDISLWGGCVVCFSCCFTLIKILVLFSLVYINSLSVSEHICHRFWRLMISKREKIPLFIMVSLMWFPCAADKEEINRWCKTSVVINQQLSQFYIIFSYCSLQFCNLSLDLVDIFDNLSLPVFCLLTGIWLFSYEQTPNQPASQPTKHHS